jgi:hypothetical protein
VVALAEARKLNPWAPLCVLGVPSVHLEAVLPLVLGDARPIPVAHSAGRPLVESIRRTVAARGVPDRAEWLGYFRTRLGSDTAVAIAAALDADERRSLRAFFQRRRLPSPRHWRHLHLLVQALASAWQQGLHQHEAAQAVGIGVRALSRTCRRSIGRQWRVAHSLGVWEAVCELGLRHPEPGLATETEGQVPIVTS